MTVKVINISQFLTAMDQRTVGGASDQRPWMHVLSGLDLNGSKSQKSTSCFTLLVHNVAEAAAAPAAGSAHAPDRVYLRSASPLVDCSGS